MWMQNVGRYEEKRRWEQEKKQTIIKKMYL